jgi:sensor domain CHASE-containing protein
MIEPDIPTASSVYGFDVLHEPRFAADMQRAIRTGHKVASAPFDLYEGGRVYLLMQPVFLGKEDGGASAGRGTLIGVVALVVYCEKLLTIAPNEGCQLIWTCRFRHRAIVELPSTAHMASIRAVITGCRSWLVWMLACP